MSLAALQNGSDIRGVAIGGAAPANLTAKAAAQIGAAFARWLAEQNGKAVAALRIGIGHDPRLTADSLSAAVAAGVLSAGGRAFDCGLCSTPAMFLSTKYPETAFDGAVMVTASHLPADRNGLKFFTPRGGLDAPDIAAILSLADGIAAPDDLSPFVSAVDLLSLYCGDLRRQIMVGVGAGDQPLSGLRIAVDAGNGAGGFFASEILTPLGADTTGSQFLAPDGTFPNHPPNPEDKGAMASIRQAVLDAKADLGLIFDTDVDRMGAVLSDGSEIARDALIAMAAALLAPDYPGSTVVTDSVTSDRLTAFLEGTLGLRHRRFVRGYKNVINEAIRLNVEGVVCPLAIETSGHAALLENYFLDDGAYLAVRLLIALAKCRQEGKALASLIEALPAEFEAAEMRIPITDANYQRAGQAALAGFEAAARKKGVPVAESCEGVRLSTPQGWLLLRLSLHDPLLPLNIEGNGPGDCAALAALAKELLTGQSGLDLTVLEGKSNPKGTKHG